MGRRLLSSESSLQNERVIAECLQVTRPTMVIGSVSMGCSQRETKDTMEPDRRQRLEALPGWSWDVLSDQWEEGFSHLKQFSENERVIAECLATTRPTTAIGSVSGLAIREQAKDTMDPDRRQRLEALPGWSWDVLSDQMGRRLLSSEKVFRTRGSLPSA